MILFSNLWVNEMTKKDLLFLKSTLAEIRLSQKTIVSTETKIRKLEQRQAAQEEIVRESKRKINRINKLPKTHEKWVSEKKKEISDVKTTLKEKRSIRKSRDLELKDAKAEKAQIIKQLKIESENEQIKNVILGSLSMIIGGVGAGVYKAELIGVGMICGGILGVVYILTPNRAIQSLNNSLIPLSAKIEQLGKVHSAGYGIGILDKKLKKLESELSKKSVEMSGIEELKAKKSDSETQIKNNKVELETQLNKIELKEILIKNNWEKVSHLIPYSDSIKLSEDYASQ
jgi:ABC-type multidrug transport system fused ATPase/permease subunit